MKINTTYSIKIRGYNKILDSTTNRTRSATDFFVQVILNEWSDVCALSSQKERVNLVERLTVATKYHPVVKYDMNDQFYKFPSYYRRAAIANALGKVSSYKSNHANWEAENPKTRGKEPTMPTAGNTWSVLYKEGCYRLDKKNYKCDIKVWIRNTWDWVTVELNKSDMNYIIRNCADRKQCSPTLRKRGKAWYLDFPFEEDVKLSDKPIWEQVAVSVDLGINNACVCTAMKSDGTVIGRHFLSLPKENDCLNKALGRLKKTQKHGARHMPRLWSVVNGINKDITVKTAAFITDVAVRYNANVIIFEHLDVSGKKRGRKKQRLHLWKSQDVQKIVTNKAHRLGMRISHICAWGTSKLAFDGTGAVTRGEYTDGNGNKHYNYSVCTFQTGKQYNCDLNASYNIGSRYFIREILKSLTEKEELALKAKVPELAKRTTCTLSSLIKLNAALCA